MWQLSFISDLPSFVNRNCSNFYVLNTTSNAHINSNNIRGLFRQRILRHLAATSMGMGFNAIVYHLIIFLSTLYYDVACCFVPRRLSLIEWFPTAENPSFCRFWCCRRSIYIVNKARFQAWITHIRKFLCYFNYDAD